MAMTRTVTLPGGRTVSALGLGTWTMGEDKRRAAAERAALRSALEMGYRVFDSAEMYAEGGAETLLGVALNDAVRAGLAREELFVVSKVYPHNASTQGVVAACERSLRRLQLDHIDLYLLHWPGSVPLRDTLAGFERLQAQGKVAQWGVSNFDLPAMQALLATPGGAACAANQVWYSLSQRGVEFDLLPWQQQRQMPLMAYSPFDRGVLARHAGLSALAQSMGCSAAQLALAWLLSRPGVMAIPKSSDPQRLQHNWQAAGLALGDEQLAKIDSMFAAPKRRQPLATG